MIERYTIKFGSAVSQKELEKIINSGEGEFRPEDMKKMKARIELVADIEDIKEITTFLKSHTSKRAEA